MNDTIPRELTRAERAAIRKLVVTMCANYDNQYGCLPLDCDCYMLNKWWTGSYCKYFRNAVLPLNPVLEKALVDNKAVKTRSCAVCAKPFHAASNNAKYCGNCAKYVHRRQKAKYARIKRSEVEK